MIFLKLPLRLAEEIMGHTTELESVSTEKEVLRRNGNGKTRDGGFLSVAF